MELFPHNREAYESAVRLFKTESRVCIVRPTGSGKSVIIAEFIKRNPSARHLLLAPGAHIFHEVQKHIEGQGEVSFATYIGLITNESYCSAGPFDYIYLDEFHRLGADVWGRNVQMLLRANPSAKVLGTSATPIRYLDDGRNMASEIFNDVIAAQMSLNSAIAEGILPAPTYVSALYSIRDEWQDMKRKIMLSDADGKETMVRELDAKVIDWERASGLDRVLKKYLTPDRRRVIVFCKDWEHLKYAQKILDPIFTGIYGSIGSLQLYAGKKESENERTLNLFSGSEDRVLILYAIEKVNEGLHSKSCNTVILLRDTISPILFYQQIGRAFSTSVVSRPLIVDLVNNFKNIQIDSFKRDFERDSAFVSPGRRACYTSVKEMAAIEFIDETLDIRGIFDHFDRKVDVWKKMFDRTKAFYQENGHVYVPYADKELREWINSQREMYKQGKLSQTRIEILRSIGIAFEQEIPTRWMSVLKELLAWKAAHGRLPTAKEDGSLYSWMVRQRQVYRRGDLSEGQVELLKDVFRLGADTTVKDRIDRLIGHFRNGNGSPADGDIKYDLDRIKDMYRSKRLADADIRRMREAHVPLDATVIDHNWLRNIKKLLAYCRKCGDTPAPGTSLYHFCINERRYLQRRRPNWRFIEGNAEVRKLYHAFKAIIATMEKPEWDHMFERLKEIGRVHGCISSQTCDKNLRQWVWRQRRFIRDGKLSPEKVGKLLTIGEVDWYGSKKGK